MIVKLLRPWNTWDAGQVFMTMQESVGKLLVSRGVGVELPSPTNEAEESKKPATSKESKAGKK